MKHTQDSHNFKRILWVAILIGFVALSVGLMMYWNSTRVRPNPEAASTRQAPELLREEPAGTAFRESSRHAAGELGNHRQLVAGPNIDSRDQAEQEHGISLPASAHNIQCREDAASDTPDRGAATIFEMNTSDLATFVAQLDIQSNSGPAIAKGDPTVNGHNVWPPGSPTFVPGNAQYGSFRHTWQGEAVPVEMLSCTSPVGDWLHIEIWKLDAGMTLVKMYTDWN